MEARGGGHRPGEGSEYQLQALIDLARRLRARGGATSKIQKIVIHTSHHTHLVTAPALGPVRAVAAQALYLALGVVGLPRQRGDFGGSDAVPARRHGQGLLAAGLLPGAWRLARRGAQ